MLGKIVLLLIIGVQFYALKRCYTYQYYLLSINEIVKFLRPVFKS